MPLSRSRRILCTLLLLVAGCGAAHAQAAPALVSQHDCFAGKFQSYGAWMKFLRAKNSLLAYAAIRWKLPEEQFTRYRRELDCRYITYRSDGQLVEAWLVQPRNRKAGKRPVIVYNRGGNRELGMLTFAHLFTHVFPMAEQGFVVAASQYRGAPGTGDGAPSPDQYGGDDVDDVVNLVALVTRLPQVDPDNLFMIGQSRGSIMTFRALLNPAVRVRAVAIYSGVYDLHELLRFRPEFDGLFVELIPGYADHRRAELDRRSVARWPARLPAGTGVLLVHGEDDERAPVASAHAFAKQLDALGRPHKAIFYPGESHFLDGHTDEIHAETLAWFRKFQVARTLASVGAAEAANGCDKSFAAAAAPTRAFAAAAAPTRALAAAAAPTRPCH